MPSIQLYLITIDRPSRNIFYGYRLHPPQGSASCLVAAEEVHLGADFYILYAPLPFLGGQLVPNPPLVLAEAMLQAGQSEDRAADLTELVMHLMATVGGSGSAEIAMPKAFSTLTKQVLFSSPGR